MFRFSLRWFAAGFLLVAPVWMSAKAAPSPNVLFIAIDDLNDWVGCLNGHPQARTPNLDGLAARGRLFTNAHCQAPICNPSRVSLLTGLHAHTTGIYDLDQNLRRAPRTRDVATLPQHFRAHGYAAVGFGKIFHGANDEASWDAFDAVGDKARNWRKHAPVSPLPGIGIRDYGPVPEKAEDFGDFIMADKAAKILRSPSEKPFFLAVGFRLPHVPLYAPPAWFDKFPLESIQLPKVLETDRDDLPPAGLEITRYMDSNPLNHSNIVKHGEWPAAVRAYLACTAFMDHCLGRVLEALDAGPHRDNTWVVLWSDHGWHLGEKELWAKRSLWDRSTRVPLILAGPGLPQPGVASARTVGLIDLYPTLLELCQLPAPGHGLEGRSLVPLLQDPQAAWDHPVLTTFQRGDHTVRTEGWRLIRYANGDEELYDMRSDPMEWQNLTGRAGSRSVQADLEALLPQSSAPDAPHGKSGARKRAR